MCTLGYYLYFFWRGRGTPQHIFEKTQFCGQFFPYEKNIGWRYRLTFSAIVSFFSRIFFGCRGHGSRRRCQEKMTSTDKNGAASFLIKKYGADTFFASKKIKILGFLILGHSLTSCDVGHRNIHKIEWSKKWPARNKFQNNFSGNHW